jgi:hypothetical protein
MSKPNQPDIATFPVTTRARLAARRHVLSRRGGHEQLVDTTTAPLDDGKMMRPLELPVNGITPILTVMVDYGSCPYLWLQDRQSGSVGVNVASGVEPFESSYMNNDLAWHFAAWAREFSQTNFYSVSSDESDWDWVDFNERGMELARRLKLYVGDYYRVVYDKPTEDPNFRLCERTEFLADGSFRVLPENRSQTKGPVRSRPHLVSGASKGVERAALDFAKEFAFTHGGAIPEGRNAGDGPLHVRYQMTEIEDATSLDCFQFNVEDADATLILYLGQATQWQRDAQVEAFRRDKPCLAVPLDTGLSAFENLTQWLQAHKVSSLYVTGPDESEQPGIHAKTLETLRRFHEANDGAMRKVLDAQLSANWHMED